MYLSRKKLHKSMSLNHLIKVFMVSLTMSASAALDSNEYCDSVKGNQQVETNSECSVPTANANNAVVLYRPTLLSKFREDARSFHFADREIVIKQDWEDKGIAAVVWDAAVVLCEYLEKNQDKYPMKGKSAIELGAGTGLVGMVAALLGAKVVATDRKLALEVLHKNIGANLPCTKGDQYIDTDSSSNQADNELCTLDLSVRELDWGQNHLDFDPKYDYVLGADIIYIEHTFKQLLETLRHLCNSNNTVLLSCKIRYDKDARFLKKMEKYFRVDQVFYDEQRDIKIFKAHLKS